MIKLYHGDCRDVIDEYIATYSNVVIVSDPPFNMNYHYDSYKDNLSEKEYDKFMLSIFSKAPSVIVHYPEYLYKLAILMGKYPTKVVSWVYNSNTAKQHRDVCFFDVKPDFMKVKQPYKNPNDKRIQERIKNGSGGGRLYDWWNINQIKNISKEKTLHPCQMPLEVMEKIIGILPENIMIIDPFMGSGTTGVACKKLNRNFIGIEMDDKYFDLCCQRIGDENDESVVKENLTTEDQRLLFV